MLSLTTGSFALAVVTTYVSAFAYEIMNIARCLLYCGGEGLIGEQLSILFYT